MASTSKKKLPLVPKVGQEIYVPTELYMSHGKDDIHGGLAKVVKVIPEMHGDRKVHGIQVEELPGKTYFWENYLAENQEKWRQQYGEQRAMPDPDDLPEFNSGALITKDDLRRWLKGGKEKGATHVVIMFDTYDRVFYPVLVMPGNDLREVVQKESGEDTSVKGVYSLSRDIEKQLAEPNAMHYE